MLPQLQQNISPTTSMFMLGLEHFALSSTLTSVLIPPLFITVFSYKPAGRPFHREET